VTGHQHLDHRGHKSGAERRIAQHDAAKRPRPGPVYQRRQKLGDVWHWATGHGIRRWHAARLWARKHFRHAASAADEKRWKAAQVAYGKKEHAARQRAKAAHAPSPVTDGFDDVTVSLIPHSADGPKFAIGGYGRGLFLTFDAVRSQFPHAHHVYYAISASDDPPKGVNKAYLDMEPGDAAISEFPGWYHRQRKRGMAAHQLGGYCSVSQAASFLAVCAKAGIPLADFDLQTAHYGRGKHVCSRTCGFGTFQADSTQYTDRYGGVSLDATHYLHF
jgi:hypothetical protein